MFGMRLRLGAWNVGYAVSAYYLLLGDDGLSKAAKGCQKLWAVKSFGLSKAAKGCRRQGSRATHSTKSIYIDDGGKGLSE